MSRQPNSNVSGSNFDRYIIKAVWEKAAIVPGYDPSVWRQDACSMWISWTAYGQTSSQYGWEVDHRQPVARGGGDLIDNLQPLNWRNNRGKGDDYPRWYCTIKA